MLNFEKFTNVGGSYATKVSIRQNGSLGLSQGAIRRFKLGEGDVFFALFYDAAAKVIGLKPTKEGPGPELVQLQRRSVTSKGKTSVTAHVSVRAFLDYYGIDYRSQKQTYEPVWSDEHGMILVDLTKPRKTAKEDDEE